MKDGYRVVDADAHVIEPDDRWAQYFDPALRDRAPRHLNDLTMPPSEYFARQCSVSADADESMLAPVIEVLGDDRIVFSTDYQHPDSKYPQAVESFLALPGVSDDSKRRIL